MSKVRGSKSKSIGGRRNGQFEAGQAALAIILGVVLVMVTLPLVADLLVTGQQSVVQTSANQQQALQAAQAGLVDFDNHVAANPYYAAAPPLGYCSANGTSASNSFLLTPNLAGNPPCTSGTTDPNDPGFSNAFDPNCTTSSATAPQGITPAPAPSNNYGWDLVSGSQSNGALNAEYQFVVDSRAVTSTTIANGTAIAYVYVTGRSGSSGHYACRSIKAAVNVLNPNSTTSTTLSSWLPPTIVQSPPSTTGYQTVTFTIIGGSGAAGGNGFFVKGGAGGLGGSVTGSFIFPNDFPGTTTPIYFGYQAGLAGSLKPKTGNGGGTGYAAGGAAGGDSGGGGGASAFCIMPSTSSSEGTCLASWPQCASITSFTSGSVPTTGCILAIAAGGGGGGEANFLIPAGAGGYGGPSVAHPTYPTAGGNGQDFLGLSLKNGGGAASLTVAPYFGTGGNGGWIFIQTKNGGNGSGPGSGTGGTGATYGLGNDGGGGGGGYYGGGGGGAGFLIDGGGGGGGGISWAGTWDNYVPGGGVGAPVAVGYPATPTGTVNGSGSISVQTQSAQSDQVPYTPTCSGTALTAAQTVTEPSALKGSTITTINVALAGAGGGGGAVPPEKSTQPYSEPGGVGGYLGSTIKVNSTTPPALTYETGCGGGGGTAAATATTVASGDNSKALSAVVTAGTLDVAASTSFTTPGQVSVVASGGTAVLAYTGAGTGTLTGVTLVSGTATWTLTTNNVVTQASTVAAGDNGVALSAVVTAGTLDVASSTAFTAPGQVSVVTGSGTAVLADTGTGTGTLTGVTLVSGTATWTLATGNIVTQVVTAGAGGGGYGAGGAGGVGTNTGTAANGGKAASGAGGGASVLCLGTSCSGTPQNCAIAPASATGCALAIAGGGGGGAEDTSDGKSTAPPGPGGPGWGGFTNGGCSATTSYEPGASWTHDTYTWYWPGDGTNPTNVVGGSGTQGSVNDENGNGSAGSQTPCAANGSGGAAGSGGTQTVGGNGGAGADGCSGSTAGNGAAGGPAANAGCESAGGGGGGGYYGGGAGGGSSEGSGCTACGGGYGGGGGSSYVYGYTNNSGVAGNSGTAITNAGDTTQVSQSSSTTPFVPPLESLATYTGSGAAGSGATTTSRPNAGASGTAGQSGVLILTWNYLASPPVVTDTCVPVSGELVQGSGTDTTTPPRDSLP